MAVDTDKLRDITRNIIKEELGGEVKRAIEETLTAWKVESGMMTQTDVEAVVDQKVTPLRAEINEIKSVLSDLKGMAKEVTDIKDGINGLRMTMDIIKEWPKDLREIRNDQDGVIARVNTNELALRTLTHDTQMAMAGAANMQLKVFGDPNSPGSPSLLKDLRTEMSIHHAQVMSKFNEVSASLAQIMPQVAANSQFRKNRQHYEAIARKAFTLARGLWEDRKWWIVGGSIAAGFLASLTHPDVQALIEALLAGGQ